MGSLKRISDKSLFSMVLGSPDHRITHQLGPINMNGRSILSEMSSCATAVPLDWLLAVLPKPAGRNSGSDAVATPQGEPRRLHPHRSAVARSSPAPGTPHPSGPRAWRLPRPQPMPGESHNVSRPAATSPRKVSAPESLPANDAPRAPPSAPARSSASAG